MHQGLDDLPEVVTHYTAKLWMGVEPETSQPWLLIPNHWSMMTLSDCTSKI